MNQQEQDVVVRRIEWTRLGPNLVKAWCIEQIDISNQSTAEEAIAFVAHQLTRPGVRIEYPRGLPAEVKLMRVSDLQRLVSRHPKTT